jgi:ribosome-associated toxin RatA of RatAB toxin-antitoxin module
MRTQNLSDQTVIAHYEFDINENPELLPMLRLVMRLVAKDYASSLIANTSHDTLILGLQFGTQVAQKQNANKISVDYHPNQVKFLIRYWNNFGKSETFHCTTHEAEGMIDALVIRMGMLAR